MIVENFDTCVGCPLVNIATGDLEQVASIPFDLHEIRAMSQAVAGKMMLVAAIDAAAKEVQCRAIDKHLPEAPNPMPALGHPERIAYGRNCPAHILLKAEGLLS